MLQKPDIDVWVNHKSFSDSTYNEPWKKIVIECCASSTLFVFTLILNLVATGQFLSFRYVSLPLGFDEYNAQI